MKASCGPCFARDQNLFAGAFHKPSSRCYTIERSVPNPPIVKDEAGEVLTLSPKDVMPGVESSDNTKYPAPRAVRS